MVGENLEIYRVVSAAHSWTWHSLLRVRLGYFPFVSLTFLGLGCSVFLPFDLCDVIMTTNPMDPKAAKLPVVSPICSRVVLLQLHLPLFLCIIQNHFVSSHLVLMMWDSLWPSFDTVTFHWHQLIIWEVDREAPFQYLRACMPQWQVLCTRWQVHIIGFRSSDFTGVRRQFMYSRFVNCDDSTLRAIIIIGCSSRTC